jgi:hypothetical protein
MTSEAMERLMMAAARGVLARIDARSHGSAIRTQAAVVRTLVDELDHHLGSEICAVFLRDQVKEELLRLMILVRESTPAEAVVSEIPQSPSERRLCAPTQSPHA